MLSLAKIEVCAALTLIASEIGILGFGRVGTALARLAITNQIAVSIAGRASAAELQFMLDFVAPGATASSAADVLQNSDIIVLAIPSAQALDLDPARLAGKVVIDATNYWAPTDGRIAAYDVDRSTSEVLQQHLMKSRLVKTFNHIGYHEMDENALPAGAPDRQALAIAGDDPDARKLVANIVDAIGFDAVDVGPLSAGRALQPGGPLFGRRLDRTQMVAHLQAMRSADAPEDGTSIFSMLSAGRAETGAQ